MTYVEVARRKRDEHVKLLTREGKMVILGACQQRERYVSYASELTTCLMCRAFSL